MHFYAFMLIMKLWKRQNKCRVEETDGRNIFGFLRILNAWLILDFVLIWISQHTTVLPGVRKQTGGPEAIKCYPYIEWNEILHNMDGKCETFLDKNVIPCLQIFKGAKLMEIQSRIVAVSLQEGGIMENGHC